jgi:DNA modification methylase
MDYRDFLGSKIKDNSDCGFDVAIDELTDKLFDFQKFIVQTALKKGRYAIFADTGLGKTAMQLEWAVRVAKHTGKSVLILAPLAVAGQTIKEGDKFNIKVQKYCIGHDQGIYITNYESLHKVDCSKFAGVVLDESSILKSFMGKTKMLIIDSFIKTDYRLACTATPSPNDHMEIGNHAQFLGVMPSNEMLARWFINDTTEMGTYRLKGHAESSFWSWVASWSMCIARPEDIGFEQSGYDLPALNMTETVVEANHDNSDELFVRNVVDATSLYAVLRQTVKERSESAAALVNNSREFWIVWVNTNAEADYCKKLIPDAIEVRGSDKPEVKEARLLGFADGDFRVLLTKPKIAQFGLNYQHCNNMAFVGISYSYESLYQAIRRCYRFGQESEVNAHIIISESEGNVIDKIKLKQKRHREMQKEMRLAMKRINIQDVKKLALEQLSELKFEGNEDWTMVNADCVETSKMIPDNVIDFSIFSPPFANLYIYSDSVADMGNCKNDEEFFDQFNYLVKDMYRTTRPGRLVAVHCKNLVNYKGRDGRAGLRDFRGDIIRLFEKNNWQYHSEVCIWKDPVIEMQRTKAHGLLYKQLRNDSSFSRQGLPDYLVIFRKWATVEDSEAVYPVASNSKPKFFDYIGTDRPTATPDEIDHHFAIQCWQRYASPVWFDIQQTKVLNCRQAREDQDEKHICPLQLDVIEKAVHLWTNKGDLVFSPFAGIGSEGFPTVKMGRRFLGIELKEQYYEYAIKNLRSAQSENAQMDMFNVV